MRCTEAVQYAKYSPRIVYIFEPSEPLRVIDMTISKNIEEFKKIMIECNIPSNFITTFSSEDSGSNKNVEDDVFNLLLGIGGIHGFYRMTHSSSLNAKVGEYDIYRSFVPDHIQ